MARHGRGDDAAAAHAAANRTPKRTESESWTRSVRPLERHRRRGDTMRNSSPLIVALALAASPQCTADFRPSLALDRPGGSQRHAMRAAALSSFLSAAAAHPKYLEYLPNGKNSYFGSLPGMSSDGAIGHDDDRSGAHLNPFGKQYPGGDDAAFGLSWNRGGDLFSEPFAVPMRKAVRLAQACHAEDVDRVELNHADDDDVYHHHHKGPVWDVKFCCKDADNDGQYNGWELGDPCCTWKKGGSPSIATGISHPGVSSQLPP